MNDIFVHFNSILIFSSDFHKVPNIKFTKIRQVGAALYVRADGQS
jgi:hypothetical protein